MGRRRSYASHNVPPAPAPAPVLSPEPVSTVSQIRSLLSAIIPQKAAAPINFSLPALPVGELFGGISNTARGLVLNDNWWVVLLIIFLFFPNLSSKMFGGLLKE